MFVVTQNVKMKISDNAKKLIELRIHRILDDFDFRKRKETHPLECPCYTSNGCHDSGNLNCFLCYCPEYNHNILGGGCKIGNPQGKGKWLFNSHLPEGKIWDCSDCTYPHSKEIAERYLKKMFNIE